MRAIRISPIGVLLALTLLWTPAPARAQETAMTVSPGAGPAGQPFTIVVTGLLEDSDQLSIGLYHEDGRTFTAFRRVRSDANGVVRFT